MAAHASHHNVCLTGMVWSSRTTRRPPGHEQVVCVTLSHDLLLEAVCFCSSVHGHLLCALQL
eukprot:scaffold217239_cov21-Tisochrysis_lutea.AAC.1